tara:strand:- start:3317 stop:3637 length:321 start_codon:yes stop_codon:yes gene_type:complete
MGKDKRYKLEIEVWEQCPHHPEDSLSFILVRESDNLWSLVRMAMDSFDMLYQGTKYAKIEKDGIIRYLSSEWDHDIRRDHDQPHIGGCLPDDIDVPFFGTWSISVK